MAGTLSEQLNETKRLAETSTSELLTNSDLERLHNLFCILKEEQVAQARKVPNERSLRFPEICRMVRIASLALKLNRFRRDELTNCHLMTRNEIEKRDRCMSHLKLELGNISTKCKAQQTSIHTAPIDSKMGSGTPKASSVDPKDSVKMTKLYELSGKVLCHGITAAEVVELTAINSFYYGEIHRFRSIRHRHRQFFSIISRAGQISTLALKVHKMSGRNENLGEVTRFKRHLHCETERFEYSRIDELRPQQQQQPQQQNAPASETAHANGVETFTAGSLDKTKMFERVNQPSDVTLKLRESQSKMKSDKTAADSFTNWETSNERLHREDEAEWMKLNLETRYSNRLPSFVDSENVQVPIPNESTATVSFSSFLQSSDRVTGRKLSADQVTELEELVKAAKLRQSEMREEYTETTQLIQLSSRLLHENYMLLEQSDEKSNREGMQQPDCNRIELVDQLPTIDETDQKWTHASSISSGVHTIGNGPVESQFVQAIQKLTDQLKEFNSKMDPIFFKSSSESPKLHENEQPTIGHLIIPTFHTSIANEIFLLLHYMRERQLVGALSHTEVQRLEQLVAQTEDHAKWFNSNRNASGSKTFERDSECVVTSRIQYIASMMVNLQHLLVQQRLGVPLSGATNLLLSTYTRLLDQQFSKTLENRTDSECSDSSESYSPTVLSTTSVRNAQKQPTIKRMFNTTDNQSISETLHNLSRKLLNDDLSNVEVSEIFKFRNNVEMCLLDHRVLLKSPIDSVAERMERASMEQMLRHAALILNTKKLLDKQRGSSLTGSEHLTLDAYTAQLKNELVNDGVLSALL